MSAFADDCFGVLIFQVELKGFEQLPGGKPNKILHICFILLDVDKSRPEDPFEDFVIGVLINGNEIEHFGDVEDPLGVNDIPFLLASFLVDCFLLVR